MIALILDGKRAVLRRGTEFELEVENREFEDRDAYSLSIDLPLKDCEENMEIFGLAIRAHVPLDKIRFSASLFLGHRCLTGTATVVSMSESSASVQFLEGRCAENFDETLDKIYINELDLGGYSEKTNRDAVSPHQAWGPVSVSSEFECVALPWVSDSSGIMYNCAKLVDGVWQWVDPEGAEDVDDETKSQDLLTIEEAKKLTWQPSLIWITRKICSAVGLDNMDFDDWKSTVKVRLLICNTLPPTYGKFDWADILPHWSVKEFFRNLEPLLQGYFDISQAKKSIKFTAYGHSSKRMTHIEPSRLVNKLSLDVSSDDKSAKYMSMKNIRYASQDWKLWPIADCEKAVRNWPASHVITSISNKVIAQYLRTTILSADNKRGQLSAMNSLLYNSTLDAYFAIYAVRRSKTIVSMGAGYKLLTWAYDNIVIPVNRFGMLVRNDIEDGDDLELQFVPAWVMMPDIDVTPTMYVKFSQMSGDEKWEHQFYAEDEDDTELRQTSVINLLERDDKEKQVFFSTISVGFYPGYGTSDGTFSAMYSGKVHPFPITDSIKNQFLIQSGNLVIAQTRINYVATPDSSMSLRLKDLVADQDCVRIDPRLKYKFSFIADEIPEVRDIFVIQGQRYVCEKLTVKFSHQAMSQIIEGIFYPVVDNES